MSFKQFISDTLTHAKISDEYKELLTRPEPLKVFQRAFIHPTSNPKNNYEVLEFIGDGIIKAVNSQYIPRRFTKELSQFASKSGTKEGGYSKTRRLFEQEKFLYPIGVKLGFWKWVKADKETKEQKRNKTLEDVIEAYIGALTENIDTYIKPGLGYLFARNWLESQLDTMEFDLTEETLDDPITRLNELYKANSLKGGVKPLKWGDAKYIDTQLFIPRVKGLPKSGNEGDLVFNEDTNTVAVYTDNDWSDIRKFKINAEKNDEVDEYVFLRNKLIKGLGINVNRDLLNNIQNVIDDYKKEFPHEKNKATIKMNIQPQQDLVDEYQDLLSGYDGAELKEQQKKYFQPMWWVGVYGNPEQTQILGSNLNFRKKESKMRAANEALQFLKSMGHEKN